MVVVVWVRLALGGLGCFREVVPAVVGVCHAPTEEELRTKIYSPEVLARLAAHLDGAAAKVTGGSLEARRIALFRREYLSPLCDGFAFDAARTGMQTE